MTILTAITLNLRRLNTGHYAILCLWHQYIVFNICANELLAVNYIVEIHVSHDMVGDLSSSFELAIVKNLKFAGILFLSATVI
jgi:hypothetical protein